MERALTFLALRRGLLVCGLDKKLRLPQQMLLCAERRSQARQLSLLALVISFISDLLEVALLGSLSSVNTLSRQCLGIGMYQPVITTGGHGQLMNILSQINHQDLQAGKKTRLKTVASTLSWEESQKREGRRFCSFVASRRHLSKGLEYRLQDIRIGCLSRSGGKHYSDRQPRHHLPSQFMPSTFFASSLWQLTLCANVRHTPEIAFNVIRGGNFTYINGGKQ